MTQTKKGGVGVSDNSRVGHDRSEIDGSEVGGGKGKDNEVGKKVQKSSKSKNLSKSKKTVGLDFLTPGTKLAFTELR